MVGLGIFDIIWQYRHVVQDNFSSIDKNGPTVKYCHIFSLKSSLNCPKYGQDSFEGTNGNTLKVPSAITDLSIIS